MFRPLFGFLFASRLPARTRSQVSFRPQLEALEDRLAPSATLIEVQSHVANNNTITGVTSSGKTVLVQANEANNNTITSLGNSNTVIQTGNTNAVQATALGSGNTIIEHDDSYTTVIALNGSTAVVTGQHGGIEIAT